MQSRAKHQSSTSQSMPFQPTPAHTVRGGKQSFAKSGWFGGVKAAFGLGILAFGGGVVGGQEVPERTPAEARIYADISYLASDDLRGRSAETPGLKVASEYIAKRFSELGLVTDLFEGQPFQYFELNGSPGASAQENQLVVTKGDGSRSELVLGEGFQAESVCIFHQQGRQCCRAWRGGFDIDQRCVVRQRESRRVIASDGSR